MRKLIPIFLFIFLITACTDARTEVHSAIRMTGPINMGSNLITNLANATSNQNAVTYADLLIRSGNGAIFNVIDYGATVTGGDNDTQAWYDAITAANSYNSVHGIGWNHGPAVLYAPYGNYSIKPGALPAINTNVECPQAMICALDNTNNYLFLIGFSTMHEFNWGKIYGWGTWPEGTYDPAPATTKGAAFYFNNYFTSNRWTTTAIFGFTSQMVFDCGVTNVHIATNQFSLGENIGYGQDILFINASDTYDVAYAFEGNRFFMEYSACGHDRAIALIGTNDGMINDNLFEWQALELHIHDTALIALDGPNVRTNRIIVNQGILPDSGNVIVSTDAHDNYFQLPWDYQNVTLTMDAGNVFDYQGWSTGYQQSQARSVFWGDSIPTQGYHQAGEILWYTNQEALGSPGAVCITAGTPGVWQYMASLVAG